MLNYKEYSKERTTENKAKTKALIERAKREIKQRYGK